MIHMLFKNKNIKDILKENKYNILLVIILIFGTIIRMYQIDKMPNGLNIDEASSGYDAFSIMKYGIDRNGNSFPVVLYAWGSGQSVLYSYIMIPLLIIFNGLTVFSMRFPMALIGSISILIIYLLLKNIFNNKKIALIGAFFLAICPWHIMKSRWGMECNIFPDIILLATLLLVIGIKNKKAILQILSFILLGISAYSYAASYLFLPIFVIGVLVFLIIKKQISIKNAIIYLGIVFIITLPLIIYLIINTFDLNQIEIFGITIPKLKVNRYEEMSTIFSGNIWVNCVDNLLATIRLMLIQSDGLQWNSLPEHGLFYFISIPFLILGIYKSIKKYNKNILNQIMNIWMISSIIFAMFCVVNINRINIVMFPCIYYIIIGIYEFIKKDKKLLISLTTIYLIFFSLFWNDYWKQDFNDYYTFKSGFEEVYDYCRSSEAENIYCEYTFKEPFIYFLFYGQEDVRNYIDTVEYFSEQGTFDNIKSYGKYKFYLPEKIEENSIVIVPQNKEINYELKEKSKVTINGFDIYKY